jgi:hypothetical protein
MPSWFGQIVLGIALAVCGAWQLEEHSRINELERQQNSANGEQSKQRAQMDIVMKSVDKIDDKLDKGFAAIDRTLGELKAQIATVSARQK